jgi:hypothetical protein
MPSRTPLLRAFAAGQRQSTSARWAPLLSLAVPCSMPQMCPRRCWAMRYSAPDHPSRWRCGRRGWPDDEGAHRPASAEPNRWPARPLQGASPRSGGTAAGAGGRAVRRSQPPRWPTLKLRHACCAKEPANIRIRRTAVGSVLRLQRFRIRPCPASAIGRPYGCLPLRADLPCMSGSLSRPSLKYVRSPVSRLNHSWR